MHSMLHALQHIEQGKVVTSMSTAQRNADIVLSARATTQANTVLTNPHKTH